MEQQDFFIKQNLIEKIRKKFFSEVFNNVELANKILRKEIQDINVLTLSHLLTRAETNLVAITIELRPLVNKNEDGYEKEQYFIYLYRQLTELYELYSNDKNKLDWNAIDKDKGKQFRQSFPLQDAIKAAIMVKEGRLKID